MPAGTSISASASVPARAPVVMRCPGPPVLYADNLSPQEARSRNCKPVGRREEGRLQDALKGAGTVRGERSAADAAHVRRVESDIEAIRRELARLR
ncbi:MAG: hypothetical protein EBR46_03145 [Betaproteobacteria bacterium]|nr:hypothetical protein [Betaproteobacteria bacterium]